MDDEIEQGHDGEKEPNESEGENLSEIARKMIDEADIDVLFFELTMFMEKWVEKFPSEYFEHGTLILQIENRQLARHFYTPKKIETSEILKFLSKYW
jgi:hypothetical protein